MKNIAVILFNLGGPDSLDAVEPFLFNLFHDKAIIRLPQPLRWFVAKMISRKRAPYTREIYKQIGNRSPLLELTQQQATQLEAALNQERQNTYKIFIAMRYWHPFASECATAVKTFQPDEIVLLPLYPQYSTTTTASSFKDWYKAARKTGIQTTTKEVGCYPMQAQFVAAHAGLIRETMQDLPKGSAYRILFSAHGLPKKIVDAGDPYQWQVEQSVAAIVQTLDLPDLDYTICYQSRVGPLEWIGPSTEAEITRAGKEGKNIVLVPVAFVSEHSETLVELDVEYKYLAEKQGVHSYLRVPALGISPDYIDALKACVILERKNIPGSSSQIADYCKKTFSQCGCK